MKFTYIDEGINAIVVDETYSEEQVRLIKKELTYFNQPHKLRSPVETSSAQATNGEIMKKNNGLFLDDVFQHWKQSDIISSAIDKFKHHDFVKECMKYNTMFKMIKYLHGMSTLISYYEDSDYYKHHIDNACFTVVSYFFNEPKQFSGGEIILYSDDAAKQVEIEIMNNRSIIFPSCTMHSVNEIKLQSKNKGDGRYCITHFLYNLREIR